MKPDNTGNNASEEILRLSTDQRRRLRGAIAGSIIAVVVIAVGLRYWFTHGNALEVMHRMNLMCYLLSAVLFAAAGYLGWYARRIFQTAQYPPPGGLVLGDTRILRGDGARIHARWLGICAVGFAALAIYAVWLPHSIASAKVPSVDQLIPQIVPEHG